MCAFETWECNVFQDYVPIPQSNPDLDYLPPPTFIGNLYHPYINQPVEYSVDPSVRFEPSYGSFTSGMSTPAGGALSDVYACNPSRVEVPSFFIKIILGPLNSPKRIEKLRRCFFQQCSKVVKMNAPLRLCTACCMKYYVLHWSTFHIVVTASMFYIRTTQNVNQKEHLFPAKKSNSFRW